MEPVLTAETSDSIAPPRETGLKEAVSGATEAVSVAAKEALEVSPGILETPLLI